MTCSTANGSFKNLDCGVNVVIVVLMCFMLAAPYRVAAMQGEATGPTLLKFYVHEKKTPPAPTIILVAPETGPPSSAKFGSVVVLDNKVTETNATDSTLFGRQLGTVVVGIDNITHYISFTFLLNTTDYAGSLSLAGITQAENMAVTGGTGTFSFATGVACAEILVSTADVALVYYTIDLKYY